MTGNSITPLNKQKTVNERFANSPTIKAGSSRLRSARGFITYYEAA